MELIIPTYRALSKKKYEWFLELQELNFEFVERSKDYEIVESENYNSGNTVIARFEEPIGFTLLASTRTFHRSLVCSMISLKFVIKQLMTAVSSIHRAGFAHSELRLETIIFDSFEKQVKIVNFSQIQKKPTTQQEWRSRKFIGSLHYISPEIIRQEPYDPRKAETWAVGVIIFGMITGKFPFTQTGSTVKNICRNIVEGRFITPISQLVSDSKAADFISSMLVVNPNERPFLEKLVDHPWLRE